MLISPDIKRVFLCVFFLRSKNFHVAARQQHVCRKGRAILLIHRSSLGPTLLTLLVVSSAIMRLIMQSCMPGIHDGRRRPDQSVLSYRQP